MKSVDYLYEILKKHPNEGWYIGKKRYTIGTSRINGKWKEAVCLCWRDRVGVIGEFYDTSEEAWEVFLAANYPKVLAAWEEKETA